MIEAKEEAFLSEYVQFGLAMAIMIAILIGSYWFVLAPSRAEKQRTRESERQSS